MSPVSSASSRLRIEFIQHRLPIEIDARAEDPAVIVDAGRKETREILAVDERPVELRRHDHPAAIGVDEVLLAAAEDNGGDGSVAVEVELVRDAAGRADAAAGRDA